MSGAEVAKIAASLTEAQRRAVLAERLNRHGRSLRPLFRLGLVTQPRPLILPKARLTPLGLRVRAYIEEQQT